MKHPDDRDIADEMALFGRIVEEGKGKVNVTMLSGAFFIEAADEILRLRSLLAGVDNLHRKIQIRLDDGEMDEVCDQCEDLWPCVTHVFLHREEV